MFSLCSPSAYSNQSFRQVHGNLQFVASGSEATQHLDLQLTSEVRVESGWGTVFGRAKPLTLQDLM